MLPTFHGHTAIIAREFRDATFLRYSLQPLSLPSCCDGCNKPFSIDHALTCKTGGLVILRHNELRDEYQCLAQWAYSNSAVWEEPLINPTFTQDPTSHQITALGDRGDLSRDEDHIDPGPRNGNLIDRNLVQIDQNAG